MISTIRYGNERCIVYVDGALDNTSACVDSLNAARAERLLPCPKYVHPLSCVGNQKAGGILTRVGGAKGLFARRTRGSKSATPTCEESKYRKQGREGIHACITSH